MLRLRALLVLLLAVAGAYANELAETEHKRVKRQALYRASLPAFEYILISNDDPDGEIYLVITNSDVVDLDANAVLLLSGQTLTVARDFDARTFNEIETVFIDETGFPPPTENRFTIDVNGPGTLFVTNPVNFALDNRRVAFFTRQSAIANFTRSIRSLPTPVPPVLFETLARMVGGGNTVTVLQSGPTVDRLMDLTTITGSESRSVMSGGGVSYFDSTIFLQSPTGLETFELIGTFFVYTGRAPLLEFMVSSPDSFTGPGTLYVNRMEGVAFYTVAPFGPGDVDVVGIINEGLVENSVGIEVDGGDTFLVNSGMTPSPRVVRLNGVLSQMFPSAVSVIHVIENFEVRILDPQNDFLNGFYNISQSFTLFDNGNFMMVTATPTPIPIELSSSGGQYYYDGLGNGFFSVNPAVASAVNQLAAMVNPPPRSLVFSLSSDSQGVVTLSENDMEIITLTGATFSDILTEQFVGYRNGGEIWLVDRQAIPIAMVGPGIDRFTANDIPNELEVFDGEAIRAFQGPGFLYVGGSRAFYTTNSMLVSRITDFLNAVAAPSVSVTSGGTLTVGGEPFVDLTEANADNIQTGSFLVYNNNTAYVVDAPQRFPSGTDIEVTYMDSTVIVSRVQSGGSRTVIKRIENVPMLAFAEGLAISDFVENSPIPFPGGGYFFQNEVTGNGFYTTRTELTDSIAEEIIRTSGNVRQVINDVRELGFFDGTRYTTYSGSATMLITRGGTYYFGGGNMFYSTDSGTNDRILTEFARVRSVTTTRQNGFVTIDFGGDSIYMFTVGSELTDASFGPFDTFSYVNGILTGARIPGSPVAVSNLTIFNGINVQIFNSSASLQGLTGGYLVIDRMVGTAFYTTSGQAMTAVQTAIQQVEEIFRRPVIDDTARGEVLLKFPTGSAPVGISTITYEGVDVTLTCRILVANPAPSVQFIYYPTPNMSVVLNATSMTPVPPTYNLLLPDVRAASNAGRYACVATNDVGQDRVEGTLTIRPATIPVFQPNFFPFIPSQEQKIVFPMSEGQMSTVILNDITELVFPCRFSGRPNPTVRFLRDNVPINTTNSAYSVSEIRPGASVLTVDIREMIGPINLICEGSTPAIGTRSGPGVTVNLIRYECSLSGFGECSATCGQGIQLGMYNCTSITNGVGVSVDFDDVPAGLFTRQQIVCQVMPCPRTVFRFFVGPFEGCSRTCEGGIDTRVVVCQERLQNVSADPDLITEFTVANVSDKMCIRAGRLVPARQRRCNVQVPCPIWIAEPFGLCSCTCGGGIRVRPSVECTLPNGTVLDDSFCNPDIRPQSQITCNTYPCLYAWQARNWTQCDDFFCQERNVTCINADFHSPLYKYRVDDSFCFDAIGQRPSGVRSCAENGYCSQGVWCVGEFDECSVTCGYGQQMRDVFCVTREEPYVMLVFSDGEAVTFPNRIEDGFCDSRFKPDRVRTCFRNCPGICREQKICKAIRNLGLCFTAIARDCCASCPNVVFPTNATVPSVDVLPFYNVTCPNSQVGFCTLRPNTQVSLCFAIPEDAGKVTITIVPNKPPTGGDITFALDRTPLLETTVPGVAPPELTCVLAFTANSTVRIYPELFTAVASISSNCSFAEFIPFRIV